MNTKRPLPILLTICMIVGLLPWTAMPALAADVAETEIDGWATLKDSGKNNGAATVTTTDSVTTITLNACIRLTAKLEIAFGESSEHPYVLDLNGYGIRYAGNSNGSVIAPTWRCKSLTLKDSGPSRATYYITLTNGRGMAVSGSAPSGTEGTDYLAVTGGYITGGSASNGGGIYFTSPFTMESGTICGNKAQSNGGVDAASFTMTGGTISYNSADSGTGGVRIGTNGTAVMTGGTIAHNSGAASTDVLNEGTFVMEGGTIGYSGHNGNSVCNYENFYLKSGSSAHCYGNFDVSYGKAAQTLHTVTVGSFTHGQIAASDPAWTDETTTTRYYASGNTVTLTASPDSGYVLDTVTVTDASSNVVDTSGTGNTRTFTMPAENMTVSATFGLIPATVPNITTQPGDLNLTYGYTTDNVLTVAASAATDTTYNNLE